MVKERQFEKLKDLGDSWKDKNPAIVVHCSAGVGRTGTLVTIFISMSRFNRNGSIEIKRTIEKIRTQRALAVRNLYETSFFKFNSSYLFILGRDKRSIRFLLSSDCGLCSRILITDKPIRKCLCEKNRLAQFSWIFFSCFKFCEIIKNVFILNYCVYKL